MRSQNVHILLSLLFQCHPNWISYFLLNLHLKDPENPWVRLKVSNGRLYVRSLRQTPETEGEWRRADRLGAPIWHRSRWQQIEIDNSNCRRTFVSLRTSFLQIVLWLLAVGQILPRWTSHPIPQCIEFLFAALFSHSYSPNTQRSCVVIYGSAADIRPPLSRDADVVDRTPLDQEFPF